MPSCTLSSQVCDLELTSARGELLAWLNELLAPNVIQKVEECGKGIIYCQILDSIYGDLPMSRLKMNAKMEYEYLDNFKILQKAFTKHRIPKPACGRANAQPIPVERLVKCKMQDNLEFLQWMKKYWDSNSRGEEYNAVERAGGHRAAPTPPSRGPTARVASGRPSLASAGGAAASRSTSAASNAQIQHLNAQVGELQSTCEGLEKERDFYFASDIELIVGERINLEDVDEQERDTLAKIQEILYQTEEGFEVPDGEEGELLDDETF
ncbi:hypothetical protein A1Q2_00320 [Trichosporon asahii var. asahii CBS 8904]|uniref:Uncharacterized protein n=2 Tax=Trichosporon asahii var. asahii TaxID=189963 RepID=K1VXS9_TRIAC|nr:hypothetical protein A1Q1_07553 [Trichosporon asahii var. asahii CBS 2479]EJT51275.1 hypothetical protein A1Q1_07553 [Trichosporon asahii var. asahii CBS 2479]EKD05361.1 hypothetical protein A1Q2_00320 [Trichosporon asahii var. asahii CBS 8904]